MQTSFLLARSTCASGDEVTLRRLSPPEGSALIVVIELTHYWWDGFIWSVRNKQVG